MPRNPPKLLLAVLLLLAVCSAWGFASLGDLGLELNPTEATPTEPEHDLSLRRTLRFEVLGAGYDLQGGIHLRPLQVSCTYRRIRFGAAILEYSLAGLPLLIPVDHRWTVVVLGGHIGTYVPVHVGYDIWGGRISRGGVHVFGYDVYAAAAAGPGGFDCGPMARVHLGADVHTAGIGLGLEIGAGTWSRVWWISTEGGDRVLAKDREYGLYASLRVRLLSFAFDD